MHQTQPNTFSRGDIQMNTCLSKIYLTVDQIDSRFVRLAFMLCVFVGGVVMGLPISGDVGG
jgi:hypothetical protein